jgi:tetratricopeptide (TPR) repeat protein
MKIKSTVVIFAAVCVFACAAVPAAAAPGKKEVSQTEAALAKTKSDEAKQVKSEKAPKPKKAQSAKSANDENTTKKEVRQTSKEYSLKTVQKYYAEGNLDKAETSLNILLTSDPYNSEALELKNKILIVKERLLAFKENIAEGYAVESERAVRDGNFFEALYYRKKADDLFPENRDESKVNMIKEELNNYAKTFGKYSKKFLKAVNYFVEGKFHKAAKLISDLAEYYPKMDKFIGMGMYNQILETNAKRVKQYYNTALSNFKKGRYDQARDDLDYAIALDDGDLKVKLLSEQINIELS